MEEYDIVLLLLAIIIHVFVRLNKKDYNRILNNANSKRDKRVDLRKLICNKAENYDII